ncbi:MAG: glycosyltransferase family 9 protein [Melioribacteraceae bacterium]
MKQKKFLIVRPDRIGDVVLSTAIPREIKQTWQDSYVVVLVRSYTKDIYLNNPFVDEVIELEKLKGKDFIRAVVKIRKYKFTHALMLLPNEWINYALFFAGIKTRVGVGHKFYQAITFVKSVSRQKYIPLRHEADYCMDLARKIGVKSENINPEIHLTYNELKEVETVRKSLLNEKKYLVGVHSTSGNSAPNWSTDNYFNLISELKKNNSIQIVITDVDIPEQLKNIDDVIYPSKDLSLRDWFAYFASMDILISSSTGPMHICTALNVKTVSLFCQLTACSPKLWGPLGNTNKVLLPSERYLELHSNEDPKDWTLDGNDGIGVQQVISAVNGLLGM